MMTVVFKTCSIFFTIYPHRSFDFLFSFPFLDIIYDISLRAHTPIGIIVT
jgi:hypothetical protein